MMMADSYPARQPERRVTAPQVITWPRRLDGPMPGPRHASGAPPRRDLHLRAVWIASELDRQMRELGREPRPLWFWKKPIVVLELRSLTDRA
jgi:hypothetical protein